MSFLDDLKNLGRKLIGGTAQTEGSQSGLQRAVMPEFQEFDKVSLRQDRKNKLKDINLMLNTDPRVDRLVYKLSSDASYGKFDVVVESATSDTEKQKAQEIINRTLKNIKASVNLKGWIKGLIRDGDLFLQLIVTAKEREVVRAKKLEASITFSNMDPEGNYPPDKSPYYQENPMTLQKIREFEAWEIVHIQWDYEDGKPYGKPLLQSCRLSWKRLDSGEKDITIRRKLRAGQRNLHVVGTPEKPSTWDKVEEYKRLNKDTIDNPLLANQDFYSNGLVDIRPIKGDETIGDIDDIVHHEGLLSIAAGVPYALLSGGREANVNRDVLEEQEEDYLRVIGDIDEGMEEAFTSILDFALLLKGVNPDSITYVFNWGAKDRKDIDNKVERASKLQSLGFSFETIFKTVDIDGLTYEEELERIQRQIADSAIPYGINTKIDPVLATIIGMNTKNVPDQSIKEEVELLKEKILAIYGGSNGNRILHNQKSKDFSQGDPRNNDDIL